MVSYFGRSFSLEEGVLLILRLIFKGEIRPKETVENGKLFFDRYLLKPVKNKQFIISISICNDTKF